MPSRCSAQPPFRLLSFVSKEYRSDIRLNERNNSTKKHPVYNFEENLDLNDPTGEPN